MVVYHLYVLYIISKTITGHRACEKATVHSSYPIIGSNIRLPNWSMRSGDTSNYIDKADVRKMLYIECMRYNQQLKITLYDEIVG